MEVVLYSRFNSHMLVTSMAATMEVSCIRREVGGVSLSMVLIFAHYAPSTMRQAVVKCTLLVSVCVCAKTTFESLVLATR